jgi:hypothetical protein
LVQILNSVSATNYADKSARRKKEGCMRGIAALEVKLIDSDAASYAEAGKPVCSKKVGYPTGAIT